MSDLLTALLCPLLATCKQLEIHLLLHYKDLRPSLNRLEVTMTFCVVKKYRETLDMDSRLFNLILWSFHGPFLTPCSISAACQIISGRTSSFLPRPITVGHLLIRSTEIDSERKRIELDPFPMRSIIDVINGLLDRVAGRGCRPNYK